MLNLLVSLRVLIFLIIFHWVRTDTNHALPHFFMMLPTTKVNLYIPKERVGMNQYELYTKITLIISLSLSEMTIVSMRIVWI